jgi:hypothetical protein
MGEPIAHDTKPQSEWFRTKNTSEIKKCGRERALHHNLADWSWN